MKKGKLYLVSIPIGNFSDITINAYESLHKSDLILCEDLKILNSLSKVFGFKKNYDILNEHNEDEVSQYYYKKLLEGYIISLISDCGTPLFADPGNLLLSLCISGKIDVEFINGPNALLTAIVLSGFDISRFFYYGFLSQKSDIRKKQISDFNLIKKTIVILETPYRLYPLLNDLSSLINNRKLFIGIDLTTNKEKQLRGFPSTLLEKTEILNAEKKFRGEFVIVIDKCN